VSEHSQQGLVFLGGLKARDARMRSAEPFGVASAVKCSVAVRPPRRLEHDVINILRF
jgi:hypothetical protein